MIRETFPVGQLQCNCTILGDELSHEAIVVDPGADLPRIMSLLAKHGLVVKQIVVTHAHIDHIAGAQQLKELTGAPVLYNQRDLPLVAMMDVQATWLGIAPPRSCTLPATRRAASVCTSPSTNFCLPGTRFLPAASAARTCPEAIPAS